MTQHKKPWTYKEIKQFLIWYLLDWDWWKASIWYEFYKIKEWIKREYKFYKIKH